MQRGLAEGIRRGRGAGHRPQQVPRGADVAAPGRPDDVVAASEATGCPRKGPPVKPQRATRATASKS